MEGKNIESKQLFKEFLKRKKIICTSTAALLFIVTGITLTVIDPRVVIGKYCSRMSKNSQIYKMLEDHLEGVAIEIYLFNVTNAERYISGLDTKLKLQEVGPFIYRQIREHDNISLDEENHILKYTPHATNFFDAEKSVGDPHKVHLFLPNIPMLLLASSKLVQQSYLLKLGFNYYARHSVPIINITVQEYLWGYEDPLLKVGNKALPGVFYFEKLGLLDRFFDPKRNLPIELDATDYKKFQIRKLGGLGGLPGLGYDINRTKCNSFVDTYEGIMFPINLTPESNLRMYHNIYCRILDLEYVHSTVADNGNDALVYRITNTSFNHEPGNECLCPYGGCLNGVSDTSPCFYDLPLGLSLAHFLHGDERLFDRIEGLKPNATKHGSEFLIDKYLGLSLASRFTIQYSLMISDVRFHTASKPFANMVLPFIWIDIVQPPLPENILSQLKLFGYLPIATTVMVIILILVGISLLIHIYRQTPRQTTQAQNKQYQLQIYTKDVHQFDNEKPLLDTTKQRS